jgi:alpha-tubulin suppressor-like RCC1 family protein
VTVQDQYGNTVTTDSSNVTIAVTGGTPSVTCTANPKAASSGVATFAGCAITKAGTYTLTATDGSLTSAVSGSFTISPGAPSAFTVSNPGTRTAGTAFSVTLTALADAYGNAPTNYAGTQCIKFSGPTASPNGTAPLYPQGSCDSGKSAVTFNASGVGTLAGVKLFDATPSTTITATDTLSGTHGTSGAFVVNGLTTMSTFVLTAASTTPTAGQTDLVTITAGDTWGNLVTTYAPTNGRVNLTFNGASTSDSGDNPTVTNRSGTQVNFGTAASIAFANGTGTATTTMRLYTAETANIVVTDGTHSNGAGLPVTVGPAAMGAFSLAAQKTVVTAGAPDNLTITALDQYDNTVTSYAGSHNLTFGGASLSGAVHPTVTNSSGTATNFGVATAITFANGVATVSGSANGVMRLYKIERAGITVAEGTSTGGPLYVAVSAAATAVSAGAFHTCALMPYGGVECWGNNDYGQLGDNTTTDRSTPIIVSGITNATQISAGKYHTCALLADHTIRCWGWNTYGQLGDGTTTDRHTPVQVSGINNAIAVSGEGGITCALLSDSTVRCWGHNAYGQVGDGTTTNRSTPTQVVGLTGATSVSAGANHACALLSAGTVWCWGDNDNGQLGDNTTNARSTPVQVHGVGNVGMLTGVASLNAGRFHTCAVLTTGHVDCWGYNNYGQVGDNTTTDRLAPVEASGVTNAISMSGGAYHTCVRLTDGTGECWGRNDQGQLGDGTTTQRMNPVAIIGVDGTGILAGVADISAGGGNGTADYEHTCALTSDQTVYCWGYNNYGQVGDSTTTTRLFAVGVALQ